MLPSRHIICAILALAISVGASLCAEVKGPSFVGRSLTPSYRAPVKEVKVLADTDVVFLAGGLDQNFGEGMKCIILRNNTIIAEIILVKVDATHSAGLLLWLHDGPNYPVQRGDIAKVKTVSTIITN